MAKQRSVNDQIPPEARRRAAKGGFSPKANWYSGRIYQQSEPKPISDDEWREQEAQARTEMARAVAADRDNVIRHFSAWLQRTRHRVAHRLPGRSRARHP